MWNEAICSPSTSSGETSATNRHDQAARPRRGAPAAGGARAALAARRAPAQAVDDAVAGRGRSGRRGRSSTKCRGTRRTIVTSRAVPAPARRQAGRGAHPRSPRPAAPAPPAAGPRAVRYVASACARLPWLRGHRCPRCALPRHRAGCPAAAAAFDRAWAPLAYEGAARELVRALKFRAALPVAGLMAAHMAANLPADLRRAWPRRRSRAHRGRAAQRRGFRPGRRCSRDGALRARPGCRSRRASGGPTAGAGRSARARTLRRSAGRFAAVATPRRRARWCSSTTSTPPARRSTRAPARSKSGARNGWVPRPM